MSLFKFKFNRIDPALDLKVNIPSRNSLVVENPSKAIWAIGGGKGGIGKTLLTSNLAVFLNWLNKRVVVVDMDLGGANLHTSLGVTPTQKTLSDFVMGEVDDINSLLTPTSQKNLFLISGAHDPLGVANLKFIQKSRLLRKFKELDADFILLDLGAGTSLATIDFFLMADEKIIVVTPEPTSIENAYRFIKTAYYRTLRNHSVSPSIRNLIETSIEQKTEKKLSTPRELIAEIERLSPEDGKSLRSEIEAFKLSLIVNQIRSRAEADIGKSIQIVCEKYFGIKVKPLGSVAYDNAVWQSIRKKVPFLVDAPNSQAVTQLESILRELLKK